MLCIKCQNHMKKTILDGVLVDYCERCKSFWLDGGEFEKIIEGEEFDVETAFQESEREKSVDKAERRDESLCPKCGEGQLHLYNRSGVKVEKCDKCDGLYFDDGELQALMDAEKMTIFQKIWHHVRDLVGTDD